MLSAKTPNGERRREELGVNFAMRHTRERLRRPAADIGALARGSHYLAPQDCSDDRAACQCARLTPLPLPGRFRRLPVECPACTSGPNVDCR